MRYLACVVIFSATMNILEAQYCHQTLQACDTNCVNSVCAPNDSSSCVSACKSSCNTSYNSCISTESRNCSAGASPYNCPGGDLNSQICRFDTTTELCSCSCLCNGSPPSCPNPACQNDGNWGCNSPILVDVTGQGFKLTNVKDGVIFDLWAKNDPQRFSWTDPSAGNAWLALDRNGNGTIDDGSELFGSATPQPPLAPGEVANGYRALASYDLTENGGNEDGFIDERDAIYDKLLLWVDRNHNGVSEPDELMTLRQASVARIDLLTQIKPYTDADGNVFEYRARLWDNAGNQRGRWAWDVFLVCDPKR